MLKLSNWKYNKYEPSYRITRFHPTKVSEKQWAVIPATGGASSNQRTIEEAIRKLPPSSEKQIEGHRGIHCQRFASLFCRGFGTLPHTLELRPHHPCPAISQKAILTLFNQTITEVMPPVLKAVGSQWCWILFQWGKNKRVLRKCINIHKLKMHHDALFHNRIVAPNPQVPKHSHDYLYVQTRHVISESWWQCKLKKCSNTGNAGERILFCQMMCIILSFYQFLMAACCVQRWGGKGGRHGGGQWPQEAGMWQSSAPL